MVDYSPFAETFWRSRDTLHWSEIDDILRIFVDDFSSLKKWSIADIWCWNGRLLTHILEWFWSYFGSREVDYSGLDTSPILLDQAREKFPTHPGIKEVSWICRDMWEMNDIFAGQKFDALFFIASFHHLETPHQREKILLHAKNILTPWGKIFIINWHLLAPAQGKYTSSKTRSYTDGSADFLIKIGKYARYYHAFSSEEYSHLAWKAWLTLQKLEWGERNSVVIFSLIRN